jgi:putative Mg2+ transporter-C (MgtC) family protein
VGRRPAFAILGGVPSDAALALRILLGFGLAFAVGFEHELRGSYAGDRTFSLVGGAAAAITAVMWPDSPQAVAGVVTGIGFIGAGVVVHSEGGLVKGVTTASAVFAVAGIGVVVGSGHPWLGVLCTAPMLLSLELRNIPLLRLLDGRRYQSHLRDDYEPPAPLHHRHHPPQS